MAFLRDSGSLVHVSDHTFGLTNLYFLDPAWICSVLLAVVKLKDNTTFSTLGEGMVTISTLQELCEESGFGSNKFDEYIQLLTRFEIALPASLNRYVNIHSRLSAHTFLEIINTCQQNTSRASCNIETPLSG